MTEISKIVTNGHFSTQTLDDYIGHAGEFILDPAGQIRFYDGSTQGGTVIGNNGGGTSLVGFTSSIESDAPNDSINVSLLLAIGTTEDITDQDVVVEPLGMGGFALSLPDGTSTGGNKRGVNAVDLQIFSSGKNSPTEIASGDYSFACNVGNTASGGHSFVCGWSNTAQGDSSHAEGNGTLAYGYASHAEGAQTQATGSYSHAEGFSTTASGAYSHAQGYESVAGGDYAHAEGFNTTASGTASRAEGQDVSTRGINYFQVYGSGNIQQNYDHQMGRLGIKAATTDATSTAMTSDQNSAGNSNQITIPTNVAIYLEGRVVAVDGASGDTSAWTFNGLVKNTDVLGIVGSPIVTQVYNDSGASAWTVALSLDNAHNAITIAVTGADATTIFWSGEIRTQEVMSNANL